MYRIYAKMNDGKKFRALDVRNGCFAYNLLYASNFPNKEDADYHCNYMNDNNDHMVFEVRKVKNV